MFRFYASCLLLFHSFTVQVIYYVLALHEVGLDDLVRDQILNLAWRQIFKIVVGGPLL